MSSNHPLIIIPARGGSKGLPGKNIKKLSGKELILYSIDTALSVVPKECITVTTDSLQIKEVVENYGVEVPFTRPHDLAMDTTPTFPVLKHALLEYMERKEVPSCVILLQPTSPIRSSVHIQEMLSLMIEEVDLVVSGIEAQHHDALFSKDSEGEILDWASSNQSRRQDATVKWRLNGSVYIYRTDSILNYDSPREFKKVILYPMPLHYSIDIDTLGDFQLCEIIAEHIEKFT